MNIRPSFPFTVTSRDVWAIALPASLAFITEPLVGFVDITVIGRLGDTDLLGGLVLGALAFDMIFALVFFLRLGTAGLTAQSIGARDADDGLVHLVRAGAIGLAVGVVLIALTWPLQWLLANVLGATVNVRPAFDAYLATRIWSAPFVLINYALLGWFYGRAAAKTGMLLQMLINGINVLVCIWLVFGLHWGVVGVALGAVAGHVAAATVGIALVFRRFGGLGRMRRLVSWTRLRDVAALGKLFALSRDLTIRSAALMSAFAYFTAQTARVGELSLASNAVLMQFLMISAFFLDGQGQAAEQLCGKAVGANYRPAFEKALWLTLGWGLFVSAAMFVVFWFGGDWLIGVMTASPEVQAGAHEFLIFAAITAFTGMPAFVMDGVMSGATLNTIIRNGMVASFAIYLLAALVLQNLWGVAGLWVAINLFFVTRATIFLVATRWRLRQLFPQKPMSSAAH
jgi:MATE family multidrug resistance protein